MVDRIETCTTCLVGFPYLVILHVHSVGNKGFAGASFREVRVAS